MVIVKGFVTAGATKASEDTARAVRRSASLCILLNVAYIQLMIRGEDGNTQSMISCSGDNAVQGEESLLPAWSS